MSYQIQRTVYKAEDGTVTGDSNKGKNTLVYVAGAVVSQEVADTLKLADLDKATIAKEEAAPPEKGTLLKHATTAETKVEANKTPPAGTVPEGGK